MSQHDAAVQAPQVPNPADRRALVLSGGGITGFLYEIGVLAAFEEALHASALTQHFDTFIGTSAGSIVAALLANDASARVIYRALREDEDSPFNFRPEDVYGAAAPSALRFAARFAGPLIGAVGRAVRMGRRATLAGILTDFQEHHPPGFYSTAPLERTLCGRFTALGYAHHFSDLNSALFVTGTDIDTGERLVFGHGDLRTVHICRAVAASCAIPIFFEPIRIDGRDVVDGAIAEATPLDIAVDQGARLIIYVNPVVPIRNDRSKLCLPLDDGHCARLSEKGVGWIGEQALRLLLAAKLADTVATLRSRHPEIVFHSIQPARDELPMFMHSVMSFAARRELLEYGFECGRRAATDGVLTGMTSPRSERGR